MTLTAEDLHSIKHLFDDRFDKIDQRFEQNDRQFASIDLQLAAIRGDIDDLALASAKQFSDILNTLGIVQDDLSVVQQR